MEFGEALIGFIDKTEARLEPDSTITLFAIATMFKIRICLTCIRGGFNTKRIRKLNQKLPTLFNINGQLSDNTPRQLLN